MTAAPVRPARAVVRITGTPSDSVAATSVSPSISIAVRGALAEDSDAGEPDDLERAPGHVLHRLRLLPAGQDRGAGPAAARASASAPVPSPPPARVAHA
ncbi:hypothetical protein GCM10010140_68980 [Streptosporangium pseudovulgare]|uniref:Uncharacterized protein n=1 Tax=Streptosporangium pseudovulgare TaxID=35765 RepID=A0ABQ2RIL6_9ACTN|nr:hypothetical protein GCM10010140_68980 [Streptosporangium pseudovulgare]